MTISYRRVAPYIASLLRQRSLEELAERLRPKRHALRRRLPNRSDITPDTVARRWAVLDTDPQTQAQLLDPHTRAQMHCYARNIENFIGTVKLPVGVVGPIRINGFFAQGDYYVPLATTEAALVASYNRGSALVSAAGGASAMLLGEALGRSPVLCFANLAELGRFIEWLLKNREQATTVAEQTSRHCRLVDLDFAVDGNNVYLLFEYTTGDAAGQNMVTFATNAALEWILSATPVRPRASYLEGNLSGDKKATALSLQRVRGRKATAEVTIGADLVKRFLRTTPEQMADLSRKAMMGGVLSGSLGVQGHLANGLAALFIALGQDAACVAEAAVGTTRIEQTDAGDLYASVSMPNLVVGTVGGGSGLPSQRACLNILGLEGTNAARALAELTASVCLAGEVSIIGAMCSGDFADAHARLARGRALS